MYKKALGIFAMLQLVFLFGTICVNGFAENRQAVGIAREIKLDERILATKHSSTIGIMNVAVSGQRVLEVSELQNTNLFNLTSDEIDILSKIVEAEAGNQDDEGRLLVANVVLNRMESEKFPDSVKEVVLQQENGVSQFSPVANGRIWQVKISEETKKAVERALSGEDISEGALYFVSRKYADSEKMKWFDNHLTYLFEHGGHEFFR